VALAQQGHRAFDLIARQLVHALKDGAPDHRRFGGDGGCSIVGRKTRPRRIRGGDAPFEIDRPDREGERIEQPPRERRLLGPNRYQAITGAWRPS
jgi:hypothetical protein